MPKDPCMRRFPIASARQLRDASARDCSDPAVEGFKSCELPARRSFLFESGADSILLPATQRTRYLRFGGVHQTAAPLIDAIGQDAIATGLGEVCHHFVSQASGKCAKV